MTMTITKDDRTTDVGLYHYAASYRAAADYLESGPDRSISTHPDAPRDFLYTHAIELYLKALLRLQGKSVDDLKSIGHDIPKLAKLLAGSGVTLDIEVGGVLELLTFENVFNSRYIVTGYYYKASTAGLQHAATELHAMVRAALRESGRVRGD
jgi:hypothetical protein